MKNLINKALENGAKVWNEKRVYINGDKMFATVFGLEQKDSSYAGTFKTIGKAKVWFDINSETLHSDTGSIRVILNSNGFKCGK